MTSARLRPELAGVPESPLVQLATAAERMPGAIKLCYGESEMPTPDFICRAAYDAARAGHTFYTHTAGCPELREAIAAKIRALHDIEYRPLEIMATVGASMAIYTAIRALVGRGDNAVIVAPAYAIYANGVTMAGGEARMAPLAVNGGRFELDLDRVKRAVDANTRVLVVNSPSNPTGWMITVGEQRALAELAARHDLTILSDEVYERLAYDVPLAPGFASIVTDRDRLIVVNSFSKTYNMTGWRLGWAQASESVIRVMASAAEFMTSNPAAPVQQAGIVALRDGEAYIAELRAHYAARRAQVQAALGDVPGVSLAVPDGAFYAWLRIEGLEDSSRLAAGLLKNAGVALAPGSAFGAAGEGCLRLCFAVSEPTLTEALARTRRHLSGG
ncbi:MAG TPA: aminotransferase class I/II-fold pyridoxal phosphate-dependent enzyme [Vicinamibacterales bacterium]|nr:aminotransferase class I/II-fold pyridoxal phosphate-dependent enzyme [Vicinamibacterales bacterium]